MKFKHLKGINKIYKSRRLGHVNFLVQSTIRKSIINTKLSEYRPSLSECQAKNNINCGGFNH